MARLIMWNIITLDGFFEGNKKWDLPFHELVWGDELEELSIRQLESASYLAFGRITYQGMAEYWQSETGRIADLMNAIPKLVFSRTLKKAAWNNSRLIHTDASKFMSDIKASEEKDIYLFGSANLASTFMQAALFDLYRIGIAPVIAGEGTPLFKPGISVERLLLQSCKQLKNGGVVLDYTC